jgi:hypothetical protein
MLAWGDARATRVGVVREGERVIGVLPLAARSIGSGGAEYELLGAGIGYRIEPLAAAGKLEAVAAAAGELLASLDPPPAAVSLPGIDPVRGWGAALAAALPGGGRVERDTTLYAPVLELGGAAGYEDWLRARGGHFRKRALADRRRFLEVGRLEVAATPAELERATEAFVALHLARWRGRGESRLDFPGCRSASTTPPAGLVPSACARPSPWSGTRS